MRRLACSWAILAVALLTSARSDASTVSMAATADVVACDGYAYCYVYGIGQPINGPGVIGDVFETSISFGPLALKLGPIAVAHVGGGVTKLVPEGDHAFSMLFEMALAGSDGAPITPYIPLADWIDCRVILGCGVDYQADGPFPEFGNVLAYGALFRLTTSGDPIPVHAGVSSGRAVPLTFISIGSSTIPIPEPDVALLLMLGLSGLGWRRRADRRSAGSLDRQSPA